MLDHRFTKVAAFLLLFADALATCSVADDRMQTQRFFDSFCVSCHGAEKSKADLRLDKIDVQRWNDPSLLNDIYTAIETGEMPPEDAPKIPKPDRLKELQKGLRSQLHLLSEQQKPGMLKRLSRVEYQNTVNDVFGSDFSLLDRLPLDNIEAGFNNNADNLHMSLFDMESYFNVANFVAESVVSDKPAPRDIVYSTKNTDIDTHSHKDNTNGFAPSLSQPSRPLVFATQSIQIKINPSVKTSGVYRIVPKGFYIQAKFVGGNRAEERLPAVTDVSEINRCNSVKGGESQRMFCIETATVSGPVYESWPPDAYFYKTYCDDIDASSGDEACKAILKRLARKLFRGPVSDAEMQQFYEYAMKALARDRSIFSGLQAGIRGMLCSPKFLFKQEGESGTLDHYAIAARMSYFLWNSLPDEILFELASQGKLKDPQVRREQTLRMLQAERADRFVRDYVHQWLDLEKLKIIEPDLSIFTVDEFDLVRDQIKEEPVEFFREVLSRNLSLVNFIDSEFVMITPELNYIYRIEGHPVATPIKRPGASKISPKDYKPKKITSEFSKVMLNKKDRYRGGLLSQAGLMLMTTNNGEYTNPFYRGAWVLKSFYGDHLETPADLEISALSPPTKTETIKETIDAHREEASCNICHKKMDPLGIALENFDVLGRWRDQYTDVSNYAPKGGKKGEHFPVDARTVHLDGRAFEGPQGLKAILMQDKERFSRSFLENILSYAMARELNFLDREHIEQLYEQSAKTNFKLRDLLLEIVSSDFFTRR